MLTILNVFPKSGTHLVRQMFSGALEFHGHIGMYDGPTGAQAPPWAIEQQLLEWSKQDGFITAHLHYFPDLAEIVHECKMLFLFRDPRDVVISHAHYVAGTPGHSLHTLYGRMPWDQQVRTSISGYADKLPDIGLRFLPYLPWMYERGVYTTSFEYLVKWQRSACVELAEWIGKPGTAGAMQNAVDPDTSPTFRKGKAGSWTEEMSETNQRLFEQTAGWLVKVLGYEPHPVQEPA